MALSLFCIISPNSVALWPTMSLWLKLDTVCNKTVAKRIWFSAICDWRWYFRTLLMMIALERGTPFESDNSTCATLRGYLSNSWALAVVYQQSSDSECSNFVTTESSTNAFRFWSDSVYLSIPQSMWLTRTLRIDATVRRPVQSSVTARLTPNIHKWRRLHLFLTFDIKVSSIITGF